MLAAESMLQLDDRRLDPFLEAFGLVVGLFRAESCLETIDNLVIRIFDLSLRHTVGIEQDLNPHVACRGVRLEVDVRKLERLGLRGRRRGRKREERGFGWGQPPTK